MKTTINGIELEFKKEITVTKVPNAVGNFVIPEEIDGCRVTGIGCRAFEGCGALTCVTIPDGIININGDAFYGCDCLDSFVVGDGNKRYRTVQGLLIEDEQTLVAVPRTLTNVDIPECVTKIGDNAFYSCTELKTVTIPDSVESIGEQAFCGCANLTGVVIPSSVKSIGDSAFAFCGNLANVTISNGIKIICKHAFFLCKSLTELKIPGSINEIGDSAFGSCFDLKRVSFTDGVGDMDISDNAFDGCTKLMNVKLSRGIMNILKVAQIIKREFSLNGAVSGSVS